MYVAVCGCLWYDVQNPEIAWSIESNDAVASVLKSRLTVSLPQTIPASMIPVSRIASDPADQLKLANLSADEFVLGARMAYQAVVNDFNRANSDPDYEFDSDGQLTEEPLRKLIQSRIQL